MHNIKEGSSISVINSYSWDYSWPTLTDWSMTCDWQAHLWLGCNKSWDTYPKLACNTPMTYCPAEGNQYASLAHNIQTPENYHSTICHSAGSINFIQHWHWCVKSCCSSYAMFHMQHSGRYSDGVSLIKDVWLSFLQPVTYINSTMWYTEKTQINQNTG